MLYDLIVIGGGPAGYLAAERAGEAGLKTLLFEKEHMGGVCLNEGCIPSKALLNSAKLYEHAKEAGAYGVHCADVKLNQEEVVARRGRVVNTLVTGVKGKMRKAKVKVVMEDAFIEGKKGDAVAVRGKSETFEAKNLIIAAGSSAAVPPIPGVKERLGGMVMTNKEVLTLDKIPEKLVVVGGGVIGLEMVCYYATVGSKVTVVEMLDHIAGPTDRELSTMLQKELEKKGVTFLLGYGCKAVDDNGVTVQAPDGSMQVLPADKVLMSVGRGANLNGYGLENLGLDMLTRPNGRPYGIATDACGRTSVANVYAVGDVNGHHMLAHTAYREAEVAVNTILGKADSMRYNANPSVIYTVPEIASVGRTEEECKEKGIEYEVKKLPMVYSGRFVAENENTTGICKVLINKKKRNVIGVHMMGTYSGEIIYGAAEMIEMQARVTDARQIIFPHPTVSEIIREVLWEFDD